jgi:hypothetical protein
VRQQHVSVFQHSFPSEAQVSLKMSTRFHFGVAHRNHKFLLLELLLRYREGERIPRVIVDGFFSVPR